MKAPAKIGVVVGGYLLAVLLGAGVVGIHVMLTSGPIAQASGGMYAFGDGILFLGVFGVGALPPTCAALYFLRPYQLFWRGISIAALVLASTGVVAVVGYITGRDPGGLAAVRILAAPLFAAFFFLTALFASNRSSRILLFVATFIEAAGFAVAAVRFVAGAGH
jgi:hypothetical protein